MPADARIDYLLIVDDSTITDPRNPVVTPSGFGLHSQCAMPLFETKTVREYRNNIQHGTIDTLWFESRQTSIPPRMLKIYKPANYDSLFLLPTLYVNDGFKAIEYNSYINVIDNLIADKKIKPSTCSLYRFYRRRSELYFLIRRMNTLNQFAMSLFH
ncbi:MAG: hypothetical protein MZV64_72400 [Ignavibacteriales bacterium]|nr:hypothetical protein [Ignavibacteriales bacterium]